MSTTSPAPPRHALCRTVYGYGLPSGSLTSLCHCKKPEQCEATSSVYLASAAAAACIQLSVERPSGLNALAGGTGKPESPPAWMQKCCGLGTSGSCVIMSYEIISATS